MAAWLACGVSVSVGGAVNSTPDVHSGTHYIIAWTTAGRLRQHDSARGDGSSSSSSSSSRERRGSFPVAARVQGACSLPGSS